MSDIPVIHKSQFTSSELKLAPYITLDNKQIAERLVVDTSTVKSHIHNMLKKTNTSNRVMLLAVLLFYNVVKISDLILEFGRKGK